MENFTTCNFVFIGAQKFKFDRYGLINTDFGYVRRFNNSILVINITKVDIPVNCPCGKCEVNIKKINPLDIIHNIPAKIYGDVIRFKKAGWKNIRVISCKEAKNELPVIRLSLTIFKKEFNIRKYILPFYYNKYKSNLTTLVHSNKKFEFILHEERVSKPIMKCCVFDDYIDNKAVYIAMLIMSAQLDGKKTWYTFNDKEGIKYVSFKV